MHGETLKHLTHVLIEPNYCILFGNTNKTK